MFASLGKRYERLLFFAAPVSLAAIAVCVVALASTRQQERIDAKCFNLAANAFSAKKRELDESWKNALPVSKKEHWGASYKLQLELAWIRADQTRQCYEAVDSLIVEQFRQPPDVIIKYFEQRSSELLSKPLEMYGVQLPNSTTVDLLGTKIQIELVSFARILQIVLLPVLLMWLGSIYTTRYRETLVIGRTSSLAEVFPHIINLYPVGDIPAPRKRNRLAPYAAPLICLMFAGIRIGLLSIFVLPPVVAYLASLYLMGNERFAPLFVGAGAVVSIFCFTTLIAELLPQHVLKYFPSPINEGL